MEENEKLNYEAVNQAVCREIAQAYVKILDVGCGTGELGEYLKKDHPHRIIHGVTYSEKEFINASEKLDKVVIQDLNNSSFLDQLDTYDCIVCSHVLEHLYNPRQLLTDLKGKLVPDGILIVALPNVLFFKQRFKFLLGDFKYSENGGLIDITHFRFFDWDSAANLIIGAGYKIQLRRADGYFPLLFIRKLSSVAKIVDKVAVKAFPGLFGHQFILVAKKL